MIGGVQISKEIKIFWKLKEYNFIITYYNIVLNMLVAKSPTTK